MEHPVGALPTASQPDLSIPVSSESSLGSSSTARPEAPPTPYLPGTSSTKASPRTTADQHGKKRKKALRACDSCRDRKLKCIWVEDRLPPVCFECAKRDITCETVRPAKVDPRKRAKLEALQGGVELSWTPSTPAGPLHMPIPSPAPTSASPASAPSTAFPASVPSTAFPASAPSTRLAGSGLDMLAHCVDRVSRRMQERSASPDTHAGEPPVIRMLGETSLTQFLEQLQPTEDLSLIDKEYGLWRSSDGSVRTVAKRAHPTSHAHVALTSEIVLELVQYYIDYVLPLFPVITVAELRALDTLSPVTILAVCAIAASSRRFSFELFDTVREFLRTAIAMDDPRSASSIQNCQALLIMTLSCEAHGAVSTRNGSRSFLLAGSGIRMAQDLGLHRKPPSDLPLDQQQERMRVWMCCLITDTCYTASPGQPSMIDLDDCFDCSTAPGLDPYLAEMYKLCMLLQRAMKAVNRVRLSKTTDAQLTFILADFDAWHASIPEALQFAGSESTIQAGMLHSMLVCFESIFLSPFVKQDALLPAHLRFRPSRARWFAVVNRAQLAIDWTLQHGEVPLDTWFIGFYALMRAASVHFFAHTKNGDVRNLRAIEAVKTGLSRWAAWAKDGPLGVRAKVDKIATLLWTAAARRHAPPAAEGAAVPAGGVGAGEAIHVLQSEVVPPAPVPADTLTPSTIPLAAPDLLPAFSLPTSPALLPSFSTLSAQPDTTEGALPDYLQTEWQGWCDSLMTMTDSIGWEFLDTAALPGLL